MPLALSRLGSCVLGLTITLLGGAISSAQPAIREIAPRGLRIGAVNTVVISGTQLSANVKVISSLPIASQQVLEGATPEQVKIALTLPSGVLPGIYEFRLVDAKGVSDRQMLGVDRLPQLPFSERIDSLPVALSGAIAGEQKLGTTFRGLAGEEISIDLETRRIGGMTKPVVRLLDASGKQIAYSSGREMLEGDARLTAMLPADGEYRVELHDSLFRAPASPFRLKIGRLQFADAIFPSQLSANTDAELEFFHQGKSWGLRAPYHAGATHPLLAAPWRPELLTGVTPSLSVSSVRQFVEPLVHDPAAPLDAGAAPVGISGRLAAPQEVDRYWVAVTAGQKYRFEMRGARQHSPIDGQIILRNEQGAELARGDDQPLTSDPLVDIDAPAGVAKLLVEVRDTQGGGSEGHVYHISASSLSGPILAASFGVDRVLIPRGGVALLPIQLNRSNFAGALKFETSKPIAGVTVATGDAPENSEIALVALTAAADASGAEILRIVGKSAAPEAAIASEVFRAADRTPVTEHQPELQRDLVVAAVDAAPLSLTWQRAEIDLLGDSKAIRCQLKLQRQPGVAGKTRIRLVTSQTQPKKTVKENNQDKVVDDIEKTLRLEGETTFASEQSDVTVILRVPADLPAKLWQVAFVAEVLSADDKAVTASAPCLPRTMKLTGQ